jgi:hypothetical protein
MADQPWFKFYAADYLLDPDVDAIPREAEALLVRMWCICHREGSCPVDVETLARKTQCSHQYVAQFKPQCEPFFELRDGKLYSRRMEDEKRRSEQAKENANKRYSKQVAVQTAVPIAVPRSDSDSGSDSAFKNPPPSKTTLSTLKENARAREPRGVPNEAPTSPGKYDPAVGLSIDFRKWIKARDELELKLAHGWGSELSQEELFQEQCMLAGVTAEVGWQLTERALKMPPSERLEASA